MPDPAPTETAVIGVLTLSDRASAGIYEDRSGRAIQTWLDRVLTSRPAVCHIVGFGDSSVDYILRFWISDPTGGLTNIRGNVFLALWDAFQEHGISIPFPQREVRLLND